VGTSPSLPAYDPRVIEQFAENLYRKASAFVVGSVVIGIALGAAFGAVPLTSLGAAWPIPSVFGFATLLLGGLFGGVIGYVVGDTRSFGYRLQAQAALCQLQQERSLSALAEAVVATRTAETARARQRAHQQAAQAAPPPEAPPGRQHEPQIAQTAQNAAVPPVTPPVSASRVA
jgi:hypothetical protein